jgi:hypothetical protein
MLKLKFFKNLNIMKIYLHEEVKCFELTQIKHSYFILLLYFILISLLSAKYIKLK